MSNPDMLNASVRANIIKEIKNDENKQRRAESLRRFEVYKQRQEKFVIDKLKQLAVAPPRKVSSASSLQADLPWLRPRSLYP